MIYITGDTHGGNDIKKLNKYMFKEQKHLTKDDYLIICGDFGGVWSNDNRDKIVRKWHNKKRYTTLFVDGNHENHQQLNEYPVTMWNGGKVHRIAHSVYHLMRGQVYEIENKTFFTMGGGTSIDKICRIEGVSWWPQEIPVMSEYEEAMKNLDLVDWKVDYVISHTTSNVVMRECLHNLKEDTSLNAFFDLLQDKLLYNWWYFGHFHTDKVFEDKRTTCLYQEVKKLSLKNQY